MPILVTILGALVAVAAVEELFRCHFNKRKQQKCNQMVAEEKDFMASSNTVLIQKGSCVTCKYGTDDDEEWYHACVRRVNSDDTLDVEYGAGLHVEDRKPLSRVLPGHLGPEVAPEDVACKRAAATAAATTPAGVPAMVLCRPPAMAKSAFLANDVKEAMAGIARTDAASAPAPEAGEAARGERVRFPFLVAAAPVH